MISVCEVVLQTYSEQFLANRTLVNNMFTALGRGASKYRLATLPDRTRHECAAECLRDGQCKQFTTYALDDETKALCILSPRKRDVDPCFFYHCELITTETSARVYDLKTAHPGTVACNCAAGFGGDTTFCNPVGNCSHFNGGCGAHSTCTATVDGYVSCACQPPYVAVDLSDRDCQDLEDPVICAPAIVFVFAPEGKQKEKGIEGGGEEEREKE